MSQTTVIMEPESVVVVGMPTAALPPHWLQRGLTNGPHADFSEAMGAMTQKVKHAARRNSPSPPETKGLSLMA